MMKKVLGLILFFVCFFQSNSWGGDNASTIDLKVLQMNIWQEGTVVKGGFDAIIDELVHVDADIVFLSEVRNYKGRLLVPRILEALKRKGKTYYGNRQTSLDVAVLSKYQLVEQAEVYPEEGATGSILRSVIDVDGRMVAAYSAHLDYKDYACYLPRGYDGATWKKMEQPVCDVAQIMEANRKSWREEGIAAFLKVAREDINKGYAVLLGGDFNEPSHLDWRKNTRDLWDHRGTVIDWDCSVMLYDGGFKDAFRKVYPNAKTHPGFTFPSDNVDVPISKLAWAPDADERDRIDFIYYYPMSGFKPVNAYVHGPDSSIVRGKRVKEESQDSFILPEGVWPTDHKAVLVEFSWKKK